MEEELALSARVLTEPWLTGRLTPDFKTIANFRKDKGPAIRGACRQFIVLCRQLTCSRRVWSRWTAASSRR